MQSILVRVQENTIALSWFGGLTRLLPLLFCALLVNTIVIVGKEPLPSSTEFKRFEFRQPQAQLYFVPGELFEASEALTREGLIGYFRSPNGPEVAFSHRVVWENQHPIDIEATTRELYVSVDRAINDRLLILNALTPLRALLVAERLNQLETTVSAYPLHERSYLKRHTFAPRPDDTYLNQAWHVENRTSDGARQGIDLNLRSAWSHTRGEEINVAISDNGADLSHPDLEVAAQHGHHFDFGTQQRSGVYLNSDAHGTAVAGLIAAEGNNGKGVIGVAPKSVFSSWVIFTFNRRGREVIVSDDALMDMFSYEIDAIDIQNHSWGNASEFQSGIDPLSNRGIEAAIRNGRQGKGIIMLRAGGNERTLLANANDDGYNGDPRSIAVGALRSDGNITSYSNPGACLLVVAPSGDLGYPGVATTDHVGAEGYVTRGRGDLANYLLGDAGFAGTSASTPLVAGIAALILSINPELTYRDVQQILLHSAQHHANNDPDIHENGAGLMVSHNAGYGLPDAGFAVNLARNWKNRPEVTEIVESARVNRVIPDTGLELVINGNSIPSSLRSIPCLPSPGVFPDDGTTSLPLQFVEGSVASPRNLTGKAVLIPRSDLSYQEQIDRAAEAGAELVISYNDREGTEIDQLEGTDFSTIPAFSISQTDGEALRDRLGSSGEISVQVELTSVEVGFDIEDTLICEHVGVQMSTTHPYRGDLRIVLQSPQGTRSVLQAHNLDGTPGPNGWVYWSTHHYYESSAGEWTLTVTDQEANDIGSLTSASLIIRGVPILDIDRDGLEDAWERRSFGSLNFGPKADPDDDGFPNAREQVLQTDPGRNEQDFRIQISRWDEHHLYLSWPGTRNNNYRLQSQSSILASPESVITLPGNFPETSIVIPLGEANSAYYTVQPR